MVELLERDRRTLTAAVLRTMNASARLATTAFERDWAFTATGANDARWANGRLWDGNPALGGIRFALERAMLAACEQGRGLAELARSTHGYTVALATLARGTVEALARADWILSSATADELLVRHASLEHADLRYPEQHQLQVHDRGSGDVVKVPVAEYRQRIADFLVSFGLSVTKTGLTELATRLLNEIYREAPELYSGMSAAAHGQGWATGNFFDSKQRKLQRNDQMLIEYCAYAIETTIQVSDKLLTGFVPDSASVDRWTSERDQVLIQLDVILKRRDHPVPMT